MRSDKKASVAAHIIMFADNKVSSPEDAPRFARLLKMGTSLCAHLILIPI